MRFKAGWAAAVIAVVQFLAGSAPALAAPGAEFKVVAATKDASHPHFGEGSPVGFVVDGVPGRTLVLVRGRTYRFDIDTGAMHDFYVSSDPRGAGIGTVTQGVVGNFTYKGVLTFTPSAETPDLVYYACRNHKFMGGTIHVVNPGEEGRIRIEEPRAAAPAQPSRPTPDKNETRQRLAFAEMYVNASDSAKRVAASDHAEAKAKLAAARERLAQARAALDADRVAEARAGADEALALMKDAARQVPSDEAQARAKARYAEKEKGAIGLLASYEQNRAALAAQGEKPAATLDEAKIGRMLESAKALAGQGKYDEAGAIIGNAMGEVSAAVNALMANRTVSYDMKFASPAEEYKYELERYASYEDLIPLAKERATATAQDEAAAEAHAGNARARRDQANAAAERQDYPAALAHIREGTEEMKAALGMLGVR